MILAITILTGLSYFTAKILVESSLQLVRKTWAECADMTRTTDFFPPYKHQ